MCGPDIDPNADSVQMNIHPLENKVKTEGSHVHEVLESLDQGYHVFESVNLIEHTFSQALKECQKKRLRSETLLKYGIQVPRSPDLKNREGCVCTDTVSPRLKGMKNSPGTPNYHRSGNIAFEKGWSSERVPLPVNSNRRYLNAMPLSFNNGKSLPSKWEDAEKWIFSPVIAGYGGSVNRPSIPPPHRRPKSKSGPLGMPTNSWYLSSFSPSMQAFDGFRYRNYPTCSPFSSSLSTVGDHLSSQADQGSESSGGASSSGNIGIVSHSADADNCIVRSASVHGWSDVISQDSLPSSREEKIDSSKDASVAFSPVVSRRDMATQMSPRSSPSSSSKGRSSFTSSPLVIKTLEVRDVQVDDRVTVKRWSKKYGSKGTDKSSFNIKVPKSKAFDVKTSSWDVKDTEKCLSKLKRKEGKITAGENLQKAKAEAEIKKLEMKLEKLRSTSMAKIMKKLKANQTKAEGMRHVVSTNHTHPNSKVTPVARKTGQFSSFSNCFTCRAS